MKRHFKSRHIIIAAVRRIHPRPCGAAAPMDVVPCAVLWNDLCGKGFWFMAYIEKYDAGIICVRNKKSEYILTMQEMIEDTQGEEDWVFDVGISYII